MIYSFDCAPGYSLVAIPNPSGAGYVFRLSCANSSGQISSDIEGLTVRAVTVSPTDNVDPITGFTDGATLGWGVALAMVAAWAITVLRRAL